VGILPLLFGSATESQLLRLLLIENYVEVKDMPVHRALVRVSSPRLQVYESHLTVEAHFQGLRYFMYHWSGTTAAVFISVFMFWYSMFGLILWRMFVAWFRGVGAKAKEEEEKKTAEAGGQVLGVPEDAAEAGAKERHTFDALLADRRKRTENFAGEEPVNTSSEGSNDGAAVVPGGVEDGRSMLDERRRRRELELQTKYGYQSLQRSDESPIVSPSSPDFRNRGGEDSQLRRRRSSHGGGAGSGSAPIMSPTSPTMSPERYLLLDPGLPNTSPPRQPAVGAAIYTSPMSSSHFHPSAGIPPPMPPLMTGGAQSYAFPYGAIGGGGQAGVPNVTAGFGHPSAPASMPGLQTTPAQATAEEPVSSTTVGTAVRPATIVQSSAAETPAETSGLPVVRDVFDEDRGFRSQAPE
ncbi:Berardinelli-Seip congenital lipodystrophy 2 (seipin), partial [Irineochytrium annulatum]